MYRYSIVAGAAAVLLCGNFALAQQSTNPPMPQQSTPNTSEQKFDSLGMPTPAPQAVSPSATPDTATSQGHWSAGPIPPDQKQPSTTGQGGAAATPSKPMADD